MSLLTVDFFLYFVFDALFFSCAQNAHFLNSLVFVKFLLCAFVTLHIIFLFEAAALFFVLLLLADLQSNLKSIQDSSAEKLRDCEAKNQLYKHENEILEADNQRLKHQLSTAKKVQTTEPTAAVSKSSHEHSISDAVSRDELGQNDVFFLKCTVETFQGDDVQAKDEPKVPCYFIPKYILFCF